MTAKWLTLQVIWFWVKCPSGKNDQSNKHRTCTAKQVQTLFLLWCNPWTNSSLFHQKKSPVKVMPFDSEIICKNHENKSKLLQQMTEALNPFLVVNEMRVFNSFVLNTHWGRKIEWICLKDFKSLFLQKNSQWSSRMNRMRINVYHFKLMREVGWLSCKWRSSWQFALFQRWTDIDLKK